MVARVSGEGVAGVAALAQAVKEVVGDPVVPAAVVLADVPGYGAHLPDMGRGRPCRRLGQRGVLVSDRRVGAQVFHPGQRADVQGPVLLADVVQAGDVLDVDQGLRIAGVGKDAILHLAQEVGTAGDDPGLAFVIREDADRFFYGLGAYVPEWFHLE